MTEINDFPKDKLGGLSLIPLLGFLALYVTAGLWFLYQGQDMAFYQFPAPSCALFGFWLALLLGYKNVRLHIKTFTTGVGDETVILMCLIFLLAGGFASVATKMGAVDASVAFGMYLLPSKLLLPGLFIVSCFISFAMGTSMGTLSTLVPIAVGLSQSANLSLPIVAGAVLGGAMFGDNLSIISDTTIAATLTQDCGMKEKMRANLIIAIPAAIITLVILFFLPAPVEKVALVDFSLLKILPYFLVLLLAVLGVHVVLVLSAGIIACLAIGLSYGSFQIFDVGKIIYDGFLSMTDVFLVTILIAGIAAIATKEGGLEYLLKKISPIARGQKSAKLVIALCVSIADICVANNTVAILLSGSVVKRIAHNFRIEKARAASFLDIFSCVWQGLIPHGAQLLLVGGLCQLSGFAIIPWTFYPIILGIVALLHIALVKEKNAT